MCSWGYEYVYIQSFCIDIETKKFQVTTFIYKQLIFSLYIHDMKKKHSIQNLFMWKVFTWSKFYAIFLNLNFTFILACKTCSLAFVLSHLGSIQPIYKITKNEMTNITRGLYVNYTQPPDP